MNQEMVVVLQVLGRVSRNLPTIVITKKDLHFFDSCLHSPRVLDEHVAGKLFTNDGRTGRASG